MDKLAFLSKEVAANLEAVAYQSFVASIPANLLADPKMSVVQVDLGGADSVWGFVSPNREILTVIDDFISSPNPLRGQDLLNELREIADCHIWFHGRIYKK